MSSDTETHSQRLTGKVKWFNNKAGYGFITDTFDIVDNDVFVHFSAINVANSQYKYLVQGEYIDFVRTKSTSGPHEYKATEVTGIKGGELMCETRNTQPRGRKPRPENKADEVVDENDGFISVGKKSA